MGVRRPSFSDHGEQLALPQTVVVVVVVVVVVLLLLLLLLLLLRRPRGGRRGAPAVAPSPQFGRTSEL